MVTASLMRRSPCESSAGIAWVQLPIAKGVRFRTGSFRGKSVIVGTQCKSPTRVAVGSRRYELSSRASERASICLMRSLRISTCCVHRRSQLQYDQPSDRAFAEGAKWSCRGGDGECRSAARNGMSLEAKDALRRVQPKQERGSAIRARLDATHTECGAPLAMAWCARCTSHVLRRARRWTAASKIWSRDPMWRISASTLRRWNWKRSVVHEAWRRLPRHRFGCLRLGRQQQRPRLRVLGCAIDDRRSIVNEVIARSRFSVMAPTAADPAGRPGDPGARS
jgi:hypothetical protein